MSEQDKDQKPQDSPLSGIGATRETGMDDDTIKDGKAEFYSGKKGRSDWLEFPIVKVIVADTHFLEGYFQCQKSECCQVLGEVRQKCATVLLQFPTDSKGAPKMTEVAGKKIPYEPEVMVWTFSGDKYIMLKNAHRQFPLDKHAILATCKEEKYQNLNFQSTNTRLFFMLPEDMQKKILASCDALYKRLDRFVGSRISRPEMLARLKLQQETPAGEQAGVVDLETLTGGAATK